MPSLMAILFTDFSVALRKVFFWFKSQTLTTPVQINITCRIRAESAGNGDSFDTGQADRSWAMFTYACRLMRAIGVYTSRLFAW